ncbi:skin secretory protein xP2-like [Triticum aestivum]|nr:skin secretory protein xP2-like [Triticum aestivum]
MKHSSFSTSLHPKFVLRTAVMQMNNKEPAADGKSPTTICSRLQRAFHARPVFGPLRRLTGQPHDGGAAATGVPGGAPAATHGAAPPPVVLPARAPAPSPVGKAPAPKAAPAIVPAAPQKPAAAKGGGKPGQVLGSTSTVAATTSKVPEKAAGGIPVPVPPPAVMAGRPAADAKAGDNKAQQTKGKIRVSSRVRKALASSK